MCAYGAGTHSVNLGLYERRHPRVHRRVLRHLEECSLDVRPHEPSKAEVELREALRVSIRQGHASRIAENLGIYPA